MNESHDSPAANDFTEHTVDELIARWQASGTSKKNFCAKNNLNYYRFRDWCYARGIKRRRRASVNQETSEPFIPIEVTSPAASSVPVLEVSYPDGRKISFYVLPEVQMLQILVG